MHLDKILVADDHPVFRKGIVTLIKDEWPKLGIVEAANGSEVIELYDVHHPDLLLIDYIMPKLNGFMAAEQLLRKNKEIKTILFTMYDTLEIALNFLKIGGRGFIMKGGENEEVINAIRSVSNGDYYYSSRFEQDILQWQKMGKSQPMHSIKLTPQQFEIVLKLSRGLTCKEIGESMKLSSRTVESYRSELIKKTNTKNTAELISYIYKQGILN
jgi:DNA-binding NarL/FixJ family response regulator